MRYFKYFINLFFGLWGPHITKSPLSLPRVSFTHSLELSLSLPRSNSPSLSSLSTPRQHRLTYTTDHHTSGDATTTTSFFASPTNKERGESPRFPSLPHCTVPSLCNIESNEFLPSPAKKSPREISPVFRRRTRKLQAISRPFFATT